MLRQEFTIPVFGMTLGVIAALVAYMAANELQRDVTVHTKFELQQQVVARGEILVVNAGYRKRIDCGGRAIVELEHMEFPGRERIIAVLALGNREPGAWEVPRHYPIPQEARPGPSRLREVLIYDCGTRQSITRSPWVHFTIF